MNCNKDMINDIISTLTGKGLIDEGKKEDAKVALNEMFSDRAFSEWWTEDVMDQLSCHFGKDCISQEDARKVLNYVMNEHDADVGISWEVIQLRAEWLADKKLITIKGYEPQDEDSDSFLEKFA